MMLPSFPLVCLVATAALVGQSSRPGLTAAEAKQVLAGLGPSSRPHQRNAALRRAIRRPHPTLKARLFELVRDRSLVTRGLAAEALAHYPDDRLLPLYERMLAAPRPSNAHRGALRGLGRLRHARSYEILVRYVDHPRICDAACQGLGLLGDQQAWELLEKTYRDKIAEAWVHAAIPSALIALDRDKASKLLLTTLRNPSAYRHHGAARYLSRIPTDFVRGEMAKLLGDEDTAMRRVGVQVLAAIGNTKSVGLLMGALAKAKGRLRTEVVVALGRLKSELAVDLLGRELRSTVHDHRLAAATALASIAHATALQPVRKALRQEESAIIKNRLLEALGKIGDRSCVAVVGKFIEDDGSSGQDPRRSSIAGYPMNTPVASVAYWALACCRDGKPPFPIEGLASFGGRQMGRSFTAAERKALRDWLGKQR